MKKCTAVLLAALAVFVAITAGTVSAADNVSNGTSICNVIATDYKCDSWSDEQYPIIDLCGEEYVPLFTTNGNIWQSHVNRLANLILDSNKTHILKPGETLDLGQGYALEVREIGIDSEEAWLEFTRNGQYVANKNVSTGTDGNRTWTVVLDDVQGENSIVVMRIHVKNLFVGTETSVFWIDGVWLTDYANARTLNIGDKIGEFTLEQIISGVDASNPGSLVFECISVADNGSVANSASATSNASVVNSTSVTINISTAGFSAFPSPEDESTEFTNKSTVLPTSGFWNFWRSITMKNK